jgi:hypothetical protein
MPLSHHSVHRNEVGMRVRTKITDRFQLRDNEALITFCRVDMFTRVMQPYVMAEEVVT